MKKIILAVCLVGLVALLACEDRDDNLAGANVRIQNNSELNFSLVQVRNDSMVYENIPSGSFSGYLEYEVAYRQDVLTIETDSMQLNFVPDSLSEPLPLGLYTYQIDVTDDGDVELTFKVD